VREPASAKITLDDLAQTVGLSWLCCCCGRTS